MNRLTAIKLMGAALIGTALMPLSGFSKPSKADLDTLELESLCASGAVIQNREFLINRPIIITDDTKDFKMLHCIIRATDGVPGFFDCNQRTKANGFVIEFNIFRDAPLTV